MGRMVKVHQRERRGPAAPGTMLCGERRLVAPPRSGIVAEALLGTSGSTVGGFL